jgi:protein-S-isoprenylcysteine O-methyltransferase Ste14
MSWLEARIPPPIVAATIALLMWLAAPATARLLAAPSLRLTLGLVIALLGGIIAVAGTVAFGRARTTVNPLKPEQASALVTGGIYRATRNPMYVGMALVLAGFAAWLWWWPALLGPATFIAYITRFQILPEERALGASFGAEFAAYRRRVRRWL